MAQHVSDTLDGSWQLVLDQLDEAVLVMDRRRVLQHVNQAARQLLGYEVGHTVGTRCRATTRGLDCDDACPLTYALEAGLDRVEDFDTFYTAADGRAVRLRVTVIPLTAEDGEFHGAVEILRPADPDPGFFMAGSSSAAHSLRQRATDLARRGGHVKLVGEAPPCRDVALAMHRFSGLASELFRDWGGSWEDIESWPPGTVYAYGDDAASLLESEPPDGWRLIVGGPSRNPLPANFQLLQLPRVEDLDGDLELMVARWLEDLAPGVTFTRDARVALEEVVEREGFAALERTIREIASGSSSSVGAEDLPRARGGRSLIDELLEAPKPMAALEECLLRATLERCGWRMQEAADLVGISRVTLWRKMKDHGIDRP